MGEYVQLESGEWLRSDKAEELHQCLAGQQAVEVEEAQPSAIVNQLWTERQAKMAKSIPAPEVKDVQPMLPESCWRGLFGDYRALVTPTTEAPEAYHFGAFAVGLGALLGRKVWTYYANQLYPNFYTVLVGKSGVPRKSTSWGRARDLLDALQDPLEPSAQILHGTGSAEGLLDCLEGNRRVVVMVADEFRTLLSKAKQEGSILVPTLTELYSCRDYQLRTRQHPVQATEPFLSIVANTTQAWLEKSLTESDVAGGFANRFVFILGEPREPLPFPPKPDPARFNRLVGSMRECLAFADELSKGPEAGELVASEEAKTAFARYYRDLWARCQEDSLQSTLLRRLPDYVWKLALLYAVLGQTRVITVDHIAPAIDASRFFEDCSSRIFAAFGESRTLRLERLVEESLEANPGRTMRARDLQRKLRIDSRYFNAVCDALQKQGIITLFTDTKDSTRRPILYVTLC